jgi:EAL domain-containing protein (putative c-di-GMP-specific phosphodiesterase class I)
VRPPPDAVGLAERLAGAWAAPFTVAGRELRITASTGIAITSERGEDASALLREADAAMHRGKASGPGRRELYDDAMRARAASRRRAEQDLRDALEREAFRLVYQPVVSLDDGRPVAVEALLRLQHPERGLLAAAEFLPLCEELGLTGPVGRWVLERACRDLVAWDRGDPDGRRLRLFLNVSAREFAHPGFVEELARAAASCAVAPDRLSLEITEAAVREDVAAAAQRLEALHGLGVRILLDDFGTGHSSLSHLLRLPLDGVKLDPAFVRSLGPGEQPAAVVAAVVDLATALGLSVVAEGVEDADQLRRALWLGCHLAQGFHVARPLTAADAARWLAS